MQRQNGPPLRKIFTVIGILAGILLVVGLCVYYPTLEAYLQALGSGAVIRPAETSGGLPFVVEAPEETPSEIKETKGVGGSYLHNVIQGDFRYRLDGVTIYNSLEEAGIPRDECVELSIIDGMEEQYGFMLLDMTVENINAAARPELDDQDYPFYMPLWPDNHMEGIEPGEALHWSGSYTCYFSLHPPMTETSKNYFFFTLAQGEQKQFQLLIVTPKQAIEEKITFLYLGSMDEGRTFALFEDAPIEG